MFGRKGKKGKEKRTNSQTELSIDDDKTLERVLADIKKRELKTIETLDLQRKGLQNLPSEIVKLYNLKVLHLYDNELKRLPPEIGNFNRVCRLTLQVSCNNW
jgi:Leucine-rich repeat (LRR) protein